MGGLPVKVQERWGVTSKGARDMGGYQSRQGVQERGSSSNWILVSCHPHRVTSGQPN